MDHRKVAQEVIQAVGRDNLVAAAHCATRLRLVLKDDGKVNQAALDANPDVKGTFKTNGQYQVIIGPGDVNNVYAEMIKETGLSELSTEDLKKVVEKDQKFNPVMAFIKLLSDIFVPIIPALVAGGLLMALNNFLTSPGLFGPKSVVEMAPGIAGASEMIQVMSAAPFIFMPILVGMSAAKRFGANQFLGAAIGMIMTTPGLLPGHHWVLFGLKVSQNNYYYQVIPVLAAVWILSVLEKWFHKRLPAAVDFTFTPLLSVIITGFLTFIVVGPVMREVSDLITNVIVWLYNTTGFIGMGIFGAVYSPIVLTGLHQSFPAIETQLISAFRNGTGFGDFIFVVASMANVAQGAATFAVWTLTKDKKMKGLSSSAGVSALLGITEPALFGVNLKLKFPFFCALAGSCVAAAFAGLTRVIAVSLGSAGFLGFLSINAKSIPMYVVAELISFAVAFALTYMYGKRHSELVDPQPVMTAADQVAQDTAAAQVVADMALNDEVVTAPVAGQAESLTAVNDPVFSTKAMGNGAAIIPSSNQIVAPVDGEITVAYETKHAYGLKSDDGAEVLIHIGIDTVNLKGDHFTSAVQQGQHVKQGDVLGTADIDAIKQAGYDPTVMVVITNTNNYANVERIDATAVQAGDNLIALTKRN
ncbi:sucrose-specific PTS transporter subunit IIBC [Ligilactobacillus saerimneri]|uniref:sucrose-specific PTS transporter subunit IIBC n=1 Tax=Ligilactobacillus saerimneri TaxID=228229 RepID=UPI0022A6D213|nr:sucrose-specific PTS transporter subunit IIBC [Ligilactobacillus saerimneri]MCZ0891220.1 sucrose-specific PTS transporter subunit IIBC [Ligilactobacillus saerimneri]